MGSCQRFMFLSLAIIFVVFALIPMALLWVGVAENIMILCVVGASTLPVSAMFLLGSGAMWMKARLAAAAQQQVEEENPNKFAVPELVSYQQIAVVAAQQRPQLVINKGEGV